MDKEAIFNKSKFSNSKYISVGDKSYILIWLTFVSWPHFTRREILWYSRNRRQLWIRQESCKFHMFCQAPQARFHWCQIFSKIHQTRRKPGRIKTWNLWTISDLFICTYFFRGREWFFSILFNLLRNSYQLKLIFTAECFILFLPVKLTTLLTDPAFKASCGKWYLI